MDAFLDQFAAAPVDGPVLRHLLEGALRHFYAFTLVVVRMSGLMIVGPVLGQPVVPANVRVLLVVALSLLITPTLAEQARRGFEELDANRNGRMTRDEVPEHLLARFDQQTLPGGVADLAATQWRMPPRMPHSLADYVWVAGGELGLGLALGFGVFVLLTGLQVAGELIDQQSGVSLGEVFNPALDTEAGLSGQFLYLLGVAVFLCLEPLSGHLMMVSALVETFRTLPVGEAFVSQGALDLLRDLVHQSLVLGVQVAAPLLATMSLVALTMGFLAQTVPQINVLVIGFPARILIAAAVLALSLSGAARAVVDLVPATIDGLRAVLSG